MRLTDEMLAEIKNRINPNYVNVQGTESHERFSLVEAIEELKSELARYEGAVKVEGNVYGGNKFGFEYAYMDCLPVELTGKPVTVLVMSKEVERDLFKKETVALASDISHQYCCWSQNDFEDVDTGSWATTCNNRFYFTDEGPDDNGMNFCCYCGKPIIVSGYKDEEQSEV